MGAGVAGPVDIDEITVRKLEAARGPATPGQVRRISAGQTVCRWGPGSHHAGVKSAGAMVPYRAPTVTVSRL